MAFQTQLWRPTSAFMTPDATFDFATQAEASAHADLLMTDVPAGTAVRVTDGQYTLEYRVAESHDPEPDDQEYRHFAPDDYPQ